MQAPDIPEIKHLVYIDVAPEKVYETPTTGEGWDAWFTEGTAIELRPGGGIHFRWENFGAGRRTLHDGGVVLAVEENRRFCFQWSPGETQTTVDFRLASRGSGTLVHLTEAGYGLTEGDLQTCIDCAIGWGEALTLLKFYLEYGLTYGQVPPGDLA